MKKCSYCGKEYGDDADTCAIDGQPLTQLEYSGEPPPALPRKPTPPPLPPRAEVPPPVLNTFSELEQQVLSGGRFVVFQYCVSVLVLSFKRSSSVIYLPPGEDGAGPAATNSLISLVAGWWGIPWGPIWTIGTVIKNASGGVDLTHAVLAEKVGAARAAQILAQRRVTQTATRGMKFFRAGLITLAALPFLFLIVSMLMSAREAGTTTTTRVSAPGQAEFRAANSMINVNHGAVGFGNSPAAIAVAGNFSRTMKMLRNNFFEGGKPDGTSISGNEFLTYCELNGTNCAVIVHVPELRRFSTDAKSSLGELAWTSAQSALRKQGLTNSTYRLAVGLRGIALYDRVLAGHTVAEAEETDTGLEQTFTEAGAEQNLFPYFRPTAGHLSEPED